MPMVAYILPYDPKGNNTEFSNKNEKHSVSDLVIVSIVGGRDQGTKLDIRFYDYE